MKNEIDWEAEQRLLDGIMTTCEISCSKCGNVEAAKMIDDIEWARYLLEKKWYATPNNIYCPKCNLKRKRRSIKK